VKTKNHYVVLDGLRGVAALTVVAFHLFEPYSLGNPFAQVINHGYLAVDFFFLLSGFVVAEMHPLNGPAWSLFFEYIANLLYAIGIRRYHALSADLCVHGLGGSR
jgi:surface polysaccharide O-acyltransferase-like enzyme